MLAKDISKAVAEWNEYTPEEEDSIQIKNTTVTIGNPPGVLLPATGGEGRLRVYLTGVALILIGGAGYILLRHRREFFR